MQIFIKSGGPTITLEVEDTYSVQRVKEMIKLKECIPVIHQRLVYAGHLLENDRDLKDYGIKKECSVHLVWMIGRPPVKDEIVEEKDLEEILNIQRTRPKKGESIESAKLSTPDMQRILISAYRGPLIHILEYLSPFYLLFLNEVCKSFHETVEFMLRNKITKFNDVHIHLMLGSRKRHISEKLLLYLCKLTDHIFNENTIVYRNIPVIEKFDRLNLLSICAVLKFDRVMKYLIKERNFTTIPSENVFNYEFLNNAFFDNRKKEHIMLLIDNFERLDITKKTLKSVFRMIESLRCILFSRLLRLLRMYAEQNKSTDNNNNNNVVANDFLYVYSEVLKEKAFLGYLSVWKRFEPIIFSEKNTPLSSLHIQLINSCFEIIDWKLFHYFLTEFPRLFPKRENVEPDQLRFYRYSVLRNRMVERDDFLRYVVTPSSDLEFLKIYRPRFLLQEAAKKNDVDEVRRLVVLEKVYRYEEDIHIFDNRSRLMFPYHEVEDYEILKMIIPVSKVEYSQYIRALDADNFRLADLMEEHIIDTKRMTCSGLLLNFEKKRYDVVLRLLRDQTWVLNLRKGRKTTYYLHQNLNSSLLNCCQILFSAIDIMRQQGPDEKMMKQICGEMEKVFVKRLGEDIPYPLYRKFFDRMKKRPGGSDTKHKFVEEDFLLELIDVDRNNLSKKFPHFFRFLFENRFKVYQMERFMRSIFPEGNKKKHFELVVHYMNLSGSDLPLKYLKELLGEEDEIILGIRHCCKQNRIFLRRIGLDD